MTMNAKILALHLTKGGVGKTTTLINLGYCLRRLGFKVLYVDADPQSSLTEFYFNLDNIKENLGDLLLDKSIYIKPLELDTNLHLIAGFPEAHSIKLKDEKMSEVLEQYRKDYDFILIDTSPALTHITKNVFYACDKIYLPVEASLMGLNAVKKTYEGVGQKIQQKYGGMFLTKYKRNTIASQEVENMLKDKCFKTYLRDASQANNAHLLGKSVIDAFPTCSLAHEYMSLTREILETIK